MIGFRPMLALAGALAMLLGSSFAAAQPAEDPPLSYRVRPGDTLISLSTNYLTRKDDYRTIQSLNRIADPYRLPIGSTLLIPEKLLRTEPVLGEVISFRGTVTVDGQPARLKMPIRQGNQIETGASSSVTVRFPDDSAITLPSQSRIRVDRLRRILLTDALDRNFRLQAGKAVSGVKKMTNPDSNFRVTTPLSVSAVRGTDFRVGFDEETGQALTETVTGTVGVAPDEEQDEIGVNRGFGVIGTKDGIQPPVPLLTWPKLTKLARGDGNTVVVAYEPVEGAKSYRVQLASDLEFRDIIDETLTEELGVSFPGFGSKPFFVRLTAFSPFGMEGMPHVYVSGRGSQPAPASNSAHDESGRGAPTLQTSMTGDDRTSPAIIGPRSALR